MGNKLRMKMKWSRVDAADQPQSVRQRPVLAVLGLQLVVPISHSRPSHDIHMVMCDQIRKSDGCHDHRSDPSLAQVLTLSSGFNKVVGMAPGQEGNHALDR